MQLRRCEDGAVPFVIGVVAAAIAAVAAWLARPLAPDPSRRAQLEKAVSALDRELAANLELMTMFDQTKQAVVLENGQLAVHRAVLEREAPQVASSVADLYARIPDAESAMERRGPANSIRDADRHLIETWEGDARAAQRALRGSLDPHVLRGWAAAIARLRALQTAR